MTATATVGNLTAAADRHKLPLPAAFTEAVDALATRYAPIPYDEPGNLADAVADAIGAGVDPFGSEQVRLILLRRNSTPLSHRPSTRPARTRSPLSSPSIAPPSSTACAPDGPSLASSCPAPPKSCPGWTS